MANYYISSGAYTAVAQWATNTLYTVGQIIRQKTAPAVGSERCFRVTTGGTSSATTEPTWVLTRSATTTDGGGPVYTECTGIEIYQGTSWAAPWARVVTAITAGFSAAGDTFFIDSAHAETSSGSVTWANISTFAAPVRLISVTRPSSAIPPVTADIAAGATVSTTGVSNIIINVTSATVGVSFYVYGVNFNCGSSSSTADIELLPSPSAGIHVFDTCGFTLTNTSASSLLIVGGSGGQPTLNLRNCNIGFGAAGQGIESYTLTHWYGGALTGTAPTNLFSIQEASGNGWDVRDVDLSLLAGSSHLVNQSASALGTTLYYNFTNCKLNAAFTTVMNGSILFPGQGDIDMACCDVAATAGEQHYRYAGSVVADTANYLTNGATDGTTHKSWKMASNANASYFVPLEGPDIFQWVPAAGSYTLVMYLSNTSGITLTDQHFGLDLEYLATASSPLGKLMSTFSSPLASGTNLASDTQPWSGQSGLTKQKVSATFTVNSPCAIRIRPRLARANTTIWFDPLPTGF